MGWRHSVRYPTPEGLEPLLAFPGVRSWFLDERFSPSYPSVSLGPPPAPFSPSYKSLLRQWLIEAPAKADLRLDAGLLAWRSEWLYELNLKTASTAYGGSGVCMLTPFSMLSRSLSPRCSLSALPPGWWHRQRPANFVDCPLTLLSTHNNPNFFHWATQPGLAPLFLQEHFGLPELENAAIAVSQRPGRPLPNYVEPILQLVAPQLPLCISPSLASLRTCRFALQAQYSPVVVSPAQLSWWRNRLKYELVPVAKPWRRLLLSRRHANKRRCCNEKELLSVLAPMGFELVELEKLSVRDQLQLFAEAAIITGVHGAGFTNLVACQANTFILELLPAQGDYNHYYLMSDALGLRHGHIIGMRTDKSTNDFIVNPESVLQLISRSLVECSQ